jgi:hypothetical protein
MMAQAEASGYQLDAYATKNEIPDQVWNDITGKPILFCQNCHPELVSGSPT